MQLSALNAPYMNYPGGIPNIVLKYCASSLYEPMTLVFKKPSLHSYSQMCGRLEMVCDHDQNQILINTYENFNLSSRFGKVMGRHHQQ